MKPYVTDTKQENTNAKQEKTAEEQSVTQIKQGDTRVQQEETTEEQSVTKLKQADTRVQQEEVGEEQSVTKLKTEETDVRQQKEHKKQYIVRLELEATGKKQEATGQEQEKLRRLLLDREDKSITRLALLDAHQESLTSRQEELEEIQRSCSTKNWCSGTSKSVIIGLLLVLVLLVLFLAGSLILRSHQNSQHQPIIRPHFYPTQPNPNWGNLHI